MSEVYRNPLSLFDIRGRVGLVAGASGSFGALAAKVLAGAGAKVVLVAGSKDALEEVAGECRELGAEVEAINRRGDTEEACAAIDGL